MLTETVLNAVRERMELAGLTPIQAAREIGVTPSSLLRHLEGEYVRSDSLSKYRKWLAVAANGQGRIASTGRTQSLFSSESVVGTRRTTSAVAAPSPADSLELPFRLKGSKRFNVVDLFSGCGGMSLGFDLCQVRGGDSVEGEAAFETVLAMDIDRKAVELLNDNYVGRSPHSTGPGRVLDLNDFWNEAEVLAYYLDGFAVRRADRDLAKKLNNSSEFGLDQLKQLIAYVDREFLNELNGIRSSSEFRDTYRTVDARVLGQTSVVGFHESLALPMTNGSTASSVGPLLWAEEEPSSPVSDELSNSDLWSTPTYRRDLVSSSRRAREMWDQSFETLKCRTTSKARGQLAASAKRIQAFVNFAASAAFSSIREAWVKWRSRRHAVRMAYLCQDGLLPRLRSLYTGPRAVDVLLGGPPCQGFSRIGRGKLRSLREGGVHVEADDESGDSRNRLLEQYILCVSALEPRVFLFENVRHFKAEVKTGTGTFHASEILNEAIEQLSNHHVKYAVASRIIDCSLHGIPQTRERYFLAAVRTDLKPGCDPLVAAEWILSLPPVSPVPLAAALDGLPSPHSVKGDGLTPTGLASRVRRENAAVNGESGASEFRRWLVQPRSSAPLNIDPALIDGHVIRPPRRDDAEWFRLMGPGRRWMDYRCDNSKTLSQVKSVIDAVIELKKHLNTGGDMTHPSLKLLSEIDSRQLEALQHNLDGSLSIRLLLECIDLTEGEVEHHLLGESYLAKGSGNNGDWIARLNPGTPSRTMVSHMAKDTYQFVHPWEPRTLSVREAARIQSFPDWFSFGKSGLVDGFRAIGNAVPPFLSFKLANRIALVLAADALPVRPRRQAIQLAGGREK